MSDHEEDSAATADVVQTLTQQQQQQHPRILVGVLDNGLRKKLLQRSKLTLSNCIDICRASECTTQKVKATKPLEDVNVVKSAKKQNNARSGTMPKKKPHAQMKRSTTTSIIVARII